MKILFIADGRSPISTNWMRFFIDRGDSVHLASTFACQPELELAGLDITPVAFSSTKRPAKSTVSHPAASRAIRLRTAIRHFLGPLTITRSARKLREVIDRIQPDLIHAMRIPYEGMLAADAYTDKPLLVSVWGNDFTLHAPATRLMSHYTRWTMKVANALHADCQRDIRLGLEWGFSSTGPTLVIPGNGGIRKAVFFRPEELIEEPVVINPRGFRAYIRNDVFFKAIPTVLKEIPQARFLCVSMEGETQAQKWIEELNIGRAVKLLAPIPHAQMARVYQQSAVLVSPSVHDGTPNTLLEGMACGCFPVAGNLESIREWIKDGENGLLTDSTNPQKLAAAIIKALKSKDLRKQAADLNTKLILEKAEYNLCMSQALLFYQRIT